MKNTIASTQNRIYRQYVKRGFLVFIVLLIVHYTYAGWAGSHYGEPWPALLMPGFKDVYAVDQVIILKTPQFHVHFSDSGDTVASLPVDKLLEGLQFSQHAGFLRAHFNDPEFSQEQRRWIKQRVTRLYPDRSAKMITLEWIRQTYRPIQDTVRMVDRELVQKILIPLPKEERR